MHAIPRLKVSSRNTWSFYCDSVKWMRNVLGTEHRYEIICFLQTLLISLPNWKKNFNRSVGCPKLMNNLNSVMLKLLSVLKSSWKSQVTRASLFIPQGYIYNAWNKSSFWSNLAWVMFLIYVIFSYAFILSIQFFTKLSISPSFNFS